MDTPAPAVDELPGGVTTALTVEVETEGFCVVEGDGGAVAVMTALSPSPPFPPIPPFLPPAPFLPSPFPFPTLVSLPFPPAQFDVVASLCAHRRNRSGSRFTNELLAHVKVEAGRRRSVFL